MTVESHDVYGWATAWRNLRFLQLMIFLLAVMVLEALFQESPVGTVAISLLYINALLVAFSATDVNRMAKYALIAFWILNLCGRLLFPSMPGQISELVFRGIGACLIAYCVFSILRFVGYSRRVTVDPLFAAVVAYLLIAVFFSQIYAITHVLLPDSFAYSADLPGTERDIPSVTFNYFSLITISTVGYGDIVPKHPLTQVLVTIEAVIGQFYVAIVVAWLVSLYAASSIERGSAERRAEIGGESQGE